MHVIRYMRYVWYFTSICNIPKNLKTKKSNKSQSISFLIPTYSEQIIRKQANYFIAHVKKYRKICKALKRKTTIIV